MLAMLKYFVSKVYEVTEFIPYFFWLAWCIFHLIFCSDIFLI